MYEGAAQGSFQRLGLQPDADARDIRRAYARELKKIDQLLDAVGFQALRDAYEAALQSAQRHADHSTPGHAMQAGAPAESSEAIVAAVPEKAIELAAPLQHASPDQLADAAIAAFCTRWEQLGDASPALFQDVFLRALADERLFGIEARHEFEMRVAHMLTHGWRLGQEAVLLAAAAAFDWSRARNLAGLGSAGAAIQGALDERTLFDNQPVSTKDAQRLVLRLLCQYARPSDAQIAQAMPSFLRMVLLFPHWLAIVAPRERVAYWDARRDRARLDDRTAPVTPTPTTARKERRSWTMPLFILLLCTFGFAMFMEGRNPVRSPSAVRRPAPVSSPDASPGIRAQPAVPASGVGSWNSAPAPPDVPVTQARIDEIMSRIDYKPGKGEIRTTRKVIVDVFVDVYGNPFGVNLVSGSGSPALDAAVKAAILSSKPFPPNVQKIFRFGVSYKPGARLKGNHRPRETH